MQIPQITRLGTGVLLFLFLCHPLLAQSATVGKDAVATPCEEAWGDRIGEPPGAPFVASVRSTMVRKRADGTISTQITEGKVARDSVGRTYFELHGWTTGRIPRPVTTFSFNDLPKHTSVSWYASSTQAIESHYPQMTRERDEEFKALTTFRTECADGPGTAVEKLGTRTLLGVVAEGVRSTREIPAGSEGNDRPVTVTEERWYSATLQMHLLNIYDDPLVGTSTWELTDLKRTEPSPALFQLPTGYTIK